MAWTTKIMWWNIGHFMFIKCNQTFIITLSLSCEYLIIKKSITLNIITYLTAQNTALDKNTAVDYFNNAILYVNCYPLNAYEIVISLLNKKGTKYYTQSIVLPFLFKSTICNQIYLPNFY